MTEATRCALCLRMADLRESHIIPKFVSRWILRSSATGKLRRGDNVLRRHQDGPKLDLLCSDCEARFNVHETWFANRVFHPRVAREPSEDSLEDPRLLPFVASLAWRSAAVDAARYTAEYRKHRRVAERAMETWRRFLLGETAHAGNHYLFRLPDEIVTLEPAGRINWFLWRSIDLTVLRFEGRPYVWWKIPGFGGLSSLGGHGLRDARAFRVDPPGLPPGHRDADPPDVLTRILISRSRDHSAAIDQIPADHGERIDRQYLRDPGWLDSPAAAPLYADWANDTADRETR